VRKPLTARQEKGIKGYKNNLPTHRDSEILLLMRIREPKTFPYSKPYELYNKSAQLITEKLSYIMMIWYYLPKKLQQSILTDTNFLRFVTEDILAPMENELKKKQGLKKKRQELLMKFDGLKEIEYPND